MTQKSTLKSKIRAFSRYGLACMSLGFGAMTINEASPEVRFKLEEHTDEFDGLVDKKQCVNPEDKAALVEVIHMASETKSGKELLDFMKANGGKIFSQNLDENINGENLNKDVIFNSQYLNSAPKLKLLSTLLHECEHARHQKIAQSYGISNDSFSSYEDRFLFILLKESLANRAGKLGALEYRQKYKKILIDKLPQDIQACADKEFHDCFLNPQENLDIEGYETDALVGHENAKPTKDTRIFLKPDWSALASLLSRGQIQQINQLPFRNFCTLNMTFQNYLKQNPQVTSIKEMKLETFKSHKKELLADEGAFKCSVLTWLPESMAEKYTRLDWATCSNQDFLKIIQTDLKEVKQETIQGTNITHAKKAMDFYLQLFFPKEIQSHLVLNHQSAQGKNS